jgi:hypothetical protein
MDGRGDGDSVKGGRSVVVDVLETVGKGLEMVVKRL